MYLISLFCHCFYGASDIGFAVRLSFRTELGSLVHHVLKNAEQNPDSAAFVAWTVPDYSKPNEDFVELLLSGDSVKTPIRGLRAMVEQIFENKVHYRA